MSPFLKLTALNVILLVQPVHCFAPQSTPNTYVRSNFKLHAHRLEEDSNNRRTLFTTAISFVGGIFCPQIASAGIDLSSLNATPSAPSTGSLADQLKAYDGSAGTRVQQIKQVQATIPTPVATSLKSVPPGVATSAMRTTNNTPSFRKAKLGTMSRMEDQLVAPVGSKFKSLSIAFEFPSDWLQLDRLLGGIQFVDQRNGDKCYILRAELPSDTTLENVDKKWFGEAIFDPQGSIAKGINIDDYKVVSSQLSSNIGVCPEGVCNYPRRRLNIKYATVTGNGLRVERRALVDSYEVDNVAYMLMATQNAVKFEAKGRERETVEAMVDSFRLER